MTWEKSNLKEIPYEIFLFKKINNKNLDPIKKETYNFSEILYIMNNISPFPVDIGKYYYYKYDVDNGVNFLLLLTLNYIHYKSDNDMVNCNNFCLDKNDLIHSINFIRKFFDYNKPYKDPDNSIVWIYPKFTVRKFLSDSIINKKYNTCFVDEETIIKLIKIIADFSLFELSNLDDKILSKGIYLNYPSLILGNIKLYEKGILNIVEQKEELSIVLDFDSSKNSNNNYITSDKERLKKLIIKVLKNYKDLSYSMEDFME